MQDTDLITVSPINGRHFTLKPKSVNDLSVYEIRKNLLSCKSYSSSDVPHLAWVYVEGFKTVVQVTYFGGAIVKPYSSDDFYFSHLKEIAKSRQHMDYLTISDIIKLIKKYGIKI